LSIAYFFNTNVDFLKRSREAEEEKDQERAFRSIKAQKVTLDPDLNLG